MTGTTHLNTTPEPGTLSLLGTGLLGLRSSSGEGSREDNLKAFVTRREETKYVKRPKLAIFVAGRIRPDLRMQNVMAEEVPRHSFPLTSSRAGERASIKVRAGQRPPGPSWFRHKVFHLPRRIAQNGASMAARLVLCSDSHCRCFRVSSRRRPAMRWGRFH